MIPAADAVTTLAALVRGDRPYSLENQETEAVLSIALATLVELSVALDRIDRLERVLAERTHLPLDDLRATRFDGDAAAERQAATDALLARALRITYEARMPVDGRAKVPA
jgi:hypothetical protein